MKDINIQPKIQEILIRGKNFDQETDSCENFIFQPENIEEIKLGSLFFVGKIDGAPEATHIINLLTSLIKREYYSNRRRKTLASLEASLKKANAAISELTKKENLKWVNKLNFICVAIIQNQLHFTALGQTKILLLRGGRLTDLTKKLVPAQDKINPKKPFQSIASGKVFNDDKIILTTSDLFQYLPQKGLRQILELGQINQLQSIIEENKNISTQGLIIIDLAPETEMLFKKPLALTLSESETPDSPRLPKRINQHLSPFWIKTEEISSNMNLIFRNYIFKARDYWRFSIIKNKPFPTTKSKPQEKVSAIPKIQGAKDAETPKNASRLPSAGRLYRELDVRQGKREAASSIARRFFYLLEKIFQTLFLAIEKIIFSFKSASLRQKKIYLLAFAIIILSAVSGRYILARGYQNQISTSENLIKAFEEKLNQINKIVSLPVAYRETEIPANDFNFLPAQINIASSNILLATASQKTNIIFSLPVTGTKNGNFIPTDLPEDINWIKTATDKNNLILLAENNEFYKFDLSSKASSRLALTLPQETKVQDMVIFNNNLYLLDSQNNKIIRCANLTNCQAWLKEKTDLSQAVSLAVDGSVYILEKNGAISQYFGGTKKQAVQIKFKPFSEQFFKIQANPESENIYLGDKTKKRIIIASKDGQLIKQYVSQKLNKLDDFQISPDAKTIFILSNKKIYQIAN